MKPMEKSAWHLRGNCKGDLQVALPQDRDGGHCHLQLILPSEVVLGVGGQSNDVPFPCNLAARAGCQSRGAGRGCPLLRDRARTPPGYGTPASPPGTEIPTGHLRWSWVTALTWVWQQSQQWLWCPQLSPVPKHLSSPYPGDRRPRSHLPFPRMLRITLLLSSPAAPRSSASACSKQSRASPRISPTVLISPQPPPASPAGWRAVLGLPAL